MSRLDDELRKAFRHEEPSPDFTARVMKAVAAAPAPRKRWWDELLALLTTPKARWVTVGAAVSLLALILATQYSRRIEQGSPGDKEAGVTQPAPAPASTERDNKAPTVANLEGSGDKQRQLHPRPRHHRVRSEGQVAPQTHEVAKSEGEIARDQLMLALHIASASLNEAQKIVKESEGQQPRTIAR